MRDLKWLIFEVFAAGLEEWQANGFAEGLRREVRG